MATYGFNNNKEKVDLTSAGFMFAKQPWCKVTIDSSTSPAYVDTAVDYSVQGFTMSANSDQWVAFSDNNASLKMLEANMSNFGGSSSVSGLSITDKKIYPDSPDNPRFYYYCLKIHNGNNSAVTIKMNTLNPIVYMAYL